MCFRCSSALGEKRESSSAIRNLLEEEQAMIAETELQEYLDEIRQEVCSRCVERPAGGPPCGPLGKPCGVELHLPALVEAVREVHSGLIEPYLHCNRQNICGTCAYLHSDHCPCPMDSLAVLVVEAIEAVDRRRTPAARGRTLKGALAGRDQSEMNDIARVFAEVTQTWIGCDWHTVFGQTGRNLQGWTAAEAAAQAVTATGTVDKAEWQAAASWLEEVERRARQAEEQAAQAVAAANAGAWEEAVLHALRAWWSEFNTGRPFRHSPPAWKRFYQVVAAAAKPVWSKNSNDGNVRGKCGLSCSVSE
jgi:hypothetical protein